MRARRDSVYLLGKHNFITFTDAIRQSAHTVPLIKSASSSFPFPSPSFHFEFHIKTLYLAERFKFNNQLRGILNIHQTLQVPNNHLIILFCQNVNIINNFVPRWDRITTNKCAFYTQRIVDSRVRRPRSLSNDKHILYGVCSVMFYTARSKQAVLGCEVKHDGEYKYIDN